MKLHYFGTALDDHGHYFWALEEDRMNKIGLSFPEEPPIPLPRYMEWPFNPEEMPRVEKGQTNYFQKGTVKFYQEKGYTICAIEGSCRDERPASKSVFFVKATFSPVQLYNLIMQTQSAKKIIDKMPFEVKWNLGKEDCPHTKFHAKVNVGRLVNEQSMNVTNFHADIEIKCTDCGMQFEFVGIPAGMSWDHPTTNVDFTELRAPIRPFTGSIATKLSFQVHPTPSPKAND